MKIKQWAETATAVTTASIVVGLVGYLVLDAVRTSYSEAYREARLLRYERLCFALYDAETGAGDPTAEAARQAALPRSLLGKLDLFFLCSHLSELEVAGAKLQAVTDMRLASLQRARQDGASAALEENRDLIALGLAQRQAVQEFDFDASSMEGFDFGTLGTEEFIQILPGPSGQLDQFQTGGAGVAPAPVESLSLEDFSISMEQEIQSLFSATLQDLETSFDPTLYDLDPLTLTPSAP